MLWHFLLESLGYFVGFRLFLWARRTQGDFLETGRRWTIVAAALLGAAAGAKVLYWLEDPLRTIQQWDDLAYLMAGKTLVGALLGGTIAVEIAKRYLGTRERTGDLFAIPLAAGIAVGRFGCFLAGTQDGTSGIRTNLPWGVNFGDGISRHPVQLYESAAMLVLMLVLAQIKPPGFERGDRFRAFLLACFSWRLMIDFLKPGFRVAGLSTLQWVCLAAILWYSRDLRRLISTRFRVREGLLSG